MYNYIYKYNFQNIKIINYIMDDENDNNNIPPLLEPTEPSHEDINNESFLDSVFEKDCSTSSYIPKIKSLTPLKSMLTYLADPTVAVTIKKNILTTVTDFIISNPYIANILLFGTKTNNKTLYETVLSFFLDKTYCDEKDFKTLSLEFLKILVQYTQCPINAYNYFFSEIAKIYNLYLPGYSQEQHKSECVPVVQENNLIDINKIEEYLNILQVIYGVWKPGISLTQDPKSYIYITQQSSINVVIDNSKKVTQRLIKSSKGLGMSMWICPKCFPNENETCALFNVDYYYSNRKKTLEGEFKIILNHNGTICFLYKEYLSKEFPPIKVNQWYLIEFNLIPCDKQITMNCEIKLYEEHRGSPKTEINKIEYSLAREDFHRDSEITSIKLLQNFIGLFGGFWVYENNTELPQFEFHLQEEPDAFWKRLQKYQHFEMKYHLCLFPFTSHYSNSQIILDSFIHGDYATLECKNKVNGIYKVPNNLSNIFLKEGINNFIPIIEIIYTHQELVFKKPDGKIIISKLLNFIFKLLLMHKDSVILALNVGFFTCFSVFLEQFPLNCLSEEIQEIILNCFTVQTKTNPENISKELFMFIYNYKVLNKFTLEKQKKLLLESEKLCIVYIVYNSYQALDKMLYILSKYDKELKDKYCCKYHKNMFIINNDNNNSSNNSNNNSNDSSSNKTEHESMASITKIFKPLIERTLMSKKQSLQTKGNILLRLARVLCLEYSPCVYKLILEIFNMFFDNENRKFYEGNYNEKDKEIVLRYFRMLERNKFIETLLHLYGLSLMDNKSLIINLFTLLLRIVMRLSNNDKEKTWVKKIYTYLKSNRIFGNACVSTPEVTKNDVKKKKLVLINDTIEEETMNNIESLTPSDSKRINIEQVVNNAVVVEGFKEEDNDNEDDVKIELMKQKVPSTVRNSQKKKISFGFDLDLSPSSNEQTQQNVDVKDNDVTNNENTNDVYEPIIEPPVMKRHNSSSDMKIKSIEFPDKEGRKINQTFAKSMTPNLSINTNAINLQASVTNDNFSYKVFKLAKHCVDYRKGSDSKLNCFDDCYNINSRISVSKLQLSPKDSGSVSNTDNTALETYQSKESNDLITETTTTNTTPIKEQKPVTNNNVNANTTKNNKNNNNNSCINNYYYPLTIKPHTKPLYDTLEKTNYFKELNDIYEIIESWFIPQSLGAENAVKLNINFDVLPMLIQFVSSSHSLLIVHNLISKIKIFVDEVQQKSNLYQGSGEEKTSKEQKAFKENIKINKKEREIFQWKLSIVQKFIKSNDFMLWLIETAFHFRIINSFQYTSPLIKDLKNDLTLTSSPMEFVQVVIDEVNKVYLELLIQSCFNIKHNSISDLITWGIYMKEVLHNPQLPQYKKEVDEFINDTLRDFYLDCESRIDADKNELEWFMDYLYEYILFNKHDSIQYNNKEDFLTNPEPTISLLNIQVEQGKSIWTSRSLFELYWKYYDLPEQLRVILQKYLSSDNNKDNGASFKQSLSSVDDIYELNKNDLYSKIIRKIIIGKDNTVTYMLNQKHKPVPLIRLSNLLFAAIMFFDNINELQDLVELLNRYQTLLYFIIIASSKSDAEQNKLSMLLNFNLSFLIEKSFFIDNPKSILYSKVLNNILTLIMQTYFIICESNEKAGKKFFSKKSSLPNDSALSILKKNYLDPHDITTRDKLYKLNKQNFINVITQFKCDMKVLPTIINDDKFFNINELFYINEMAKRKVHRRQHIFHMKPFYSYKDITCDNEQITSNYKTIIKTPYYIQKDDYKEITQFEKDIKQVVETCKYEIYRGKEQRASEVKTRRNIYRKIKKRLFSYGGLWCNWSVMYDVDNNKLKKKVLNHYTKAMTRPLLGPILDMNYYLPKFSEENVQKIFKNEKDIYVINTNINSIYERSTKEEKVVVDDTKCNLIQSIYKNNISEDIQNIYKTLKGDKEYARNIFLESIMPYDCGVTDNEKEHLKVFRCCLVKQTHHIQGIMNIEKEDCFIFKPIPLELRTEIKDNPEYDSDRSTCYGSTFKLHLKDNYKPPIEINFSKIKYILKRKYFLRHTAIEIFTWNNKNLFFQFYTPEDRTTFFSILKLKGKPDFDEIKVKGRDRGTETIGYYHHNKQFPLTKPLFTTQDELYYKWKEWQISNMEFLMWVNILGNRSYSDLTQYPVFPWVVLNYISKDKPRKQERNLNIPIGMMKLSSYATIRSANNNSILTPEEEKCKQSWETQMKLCELRRSNFIDNYYFMLNNLKEELQIEVIEDEEQDNVDESELQQQVNQTQLQQVNKNVTEMSKEEEDKIKQNEKYYNRIEKYAKEEEQINKLPYCFGSHYSNPIYVNHFMLRLFPYSAILIEMQGKKFDDPQRLFYSLKNTFFSTSTQKSDVRELIPEFYYLPEMMLNINQFNFGEALEVDEVSNEERFFQIDNVDLPLWSKNSYEFMITLYTIFEQSKVNDWINIIFGYYQQGRGARKRHNVFLPYSYDNMVNDAEMNLRLVELGLTPIKVYNEDVNDKATKISRQQITTNTKLSNNIRKCRLFSFATNVCYLLGKDKSIIFLYDDYSFGKVTVPEHINDTLSGRNFESPWVQPTQQSATKTNDNTSTNIGSVNVPLYPRISQLHFFTNNIESYKHHTYVSYKEGTVFGIGGFWDGMILVIDQNKHYHYALKPLNSSENKKQQQNDNERIDNVYNRDKSPIVFMVKDDKEEFVYCGSLAGTVFQFQIKHHDSNNNNTWSLTNSLSHHQGEITYINVNSKLNVIGTCAKDKYIYLYRLPDLEIFNSIYINDDFDVDYLFISNAPLPSFIIYSIKDSLFRSYSINGGLICEKKARKLRKKNESSNTEDNSEISVDEYDDGLLISPIVFTDNKFVDYLAYGTMKGEVVIRELPLMKLNKRKVAFEKTNQDYDKPVRTTIAATTNLGHHMYSLSSKFPETIDIDGNAIPIRWISFSSELKMLFVIGDCESIDTIVDYFTVHTAVKQNVNTTGSSNK